MSEKTILNIKYNNDLITLDKNLSQIRYLEDYKEKGIIEFIDIPNYKWSELIPNFNSKPLFIKECVKEVLEYELNKVLNLNEMRFIK